MRRIARVAAPSVGRSFRSAAPPVHCRDLRVASAPAVYASRRGIASHLDAGSAAIRGFWRSVESWQRGLVAGVGVCMGVGAVAYVLWEPVASDAAHSTKKHAEDMLQDVGMREQAITATQELITVVLRSDDSVKLLVDVVDRLLADEGSKKSVATFLKDLFEDHYTQEVTKKFVLTVVEDEWVRDQLVVVARNLVIALLKDEETREAMRVFLVETSENALKEPSLHQRGGDAIRSTLGGVLTPWRWGGGKS